MGKIGQEFKSSLIRNHSYNNEVITGEVSFPAIKKVVLVEIDPELGMPSLDDFYELDSKLKTFIKHFTTENYNQLLLSISEKILALYHKKSNRSTEDSLRMLKRYLDLQSIVISPDGYSLSFTAENIFPEQQLIAQLTNSIEVDSLTVSQA